MLRRTFRIFSTVAALFAVCLVTALAFSATAEASSSYPDEVIRLVNVERSKVGAPALRRHERLTDAARLRAEEASRDFSHTRPNGSKWRTVFDEFHIRASFRGENLAYGQTSPKMVVEDWMSSDTHRKNILNGEFDHIAIGIYERAGVLYWSQLFIQTVDFSPKAEGVLGAVEEAAEGIAPSDEGADLANEECSYARVIDGHLNVRAGASTKAEIVAVAELGSELTVLKIADGWAYVQMSDGTEGWVSMRYLTFDPHSDA